LIHLQPIETNGKKNSSNLPIEMELEFGGEVETD